MFSIMMDRTLHPVFLVPKLCLGMHSPTLCVDPLDEINFNPTYPHSLLRKEAGIPKLRLGTRKKWDSQPGGFHVVPRHRP